MKSNEFRPVLKKRLPEIEALCRSHFVERLYVFGSVLTDRFKANSDVDFVVTFVGVEQLSYAKNYFDLLGKLEGLFGREVDLIEEQTINNPYLKANIDRNKQLVYAGRRSQNMAA